MDLRIRDLIFWTSVFRALEQIEIYYGWSHARTLWDGLGYVIFIAAVSYGGGAIYDRWRIVRRIQQ